MAVQKYIIETWYKITFPTNGIQNNKAGPMQFANGGIGNKEQEDASAQLFRAVSSGGLLHQIDSYKASLEACVGGDVNEIASLSSSLVDCENTIRRSFL